MLRAAIDIGSNTFRLLIARAATNTYPFPPWETACYTHRIVRLGEGLHHTGRLSTTGMQRAMAALGEFANIIQDYGIRPEKAHAVATSAMRDARNGKEFSLRIRKETGLHIRIIDGETEASMSLNGASAVLKNSTRSDMLLIDIGGGSTEFIRTKQKQSGDAISCRLGVVRLVDAYLTSDPPSNPDYQAMKNEVLKHLSTVDMYWNDGQNPTHLAGTAGTVTTLAAIHLDLFPYDANVVNNHVITQTEFMVLRDRLLHLTHHERQAMRTIETGRADLMVAGLAIIEAVIEHWDYKELVVVDAGLLEGAWLATGITQHPKSKRV